MGGSRRQWTEFQRTVHDTVRTIPEGKVTTYGRVAVKAGYHKDWARAVGGALRVGYDEHSVPWWRVVWHTWKLPVPRDPAGRRTDRRHRVDRLRREGIELDEHDRVRAEYRLRDW